MNSYQMKSVILFNLFLAFWIVGAENVPENRLNLSSATNATDRLPSSSSPPPPYSSSETNSDPMQLAITLNSAIEMLNMISRLSTQTNDFFRTASKLASENGIPVNDPVTFIPSIIIYGAVKSLSYLVSMLIYLSSLIVPGQIESNAKISFIDLDSLNSIDYEFISNSVRMVPEHSFRLLDIKEEPCKSRAMCEIGQYIHSYWPHFAAYIRLAMERLNVRDTNFGSILRGLGWADCDQKFRQSCNRSPFNKFHQIFYSMSKLYYSIK